MPAHTSEFRAEHDAEFFASLPASAAVFVLRGEDATAEPYVSKTSNLRRRMMRLLSAPEGATKRLNLRDRVRRLEYSPVGSDFEAGFVLYRVLRETFPSTYEKRLRLRAAPLVKLILDNEYPRVTVTTRISSLRKAAGEGPARARYYGPFATRAAAEQFANDSLDFFLVRRCTDDLHPDPAFPGCVYSEMKMCMAPCFKGCTDEAYTNEVERVEHYFASGGRSLVTEITAARDKASEELAFETAAAMHVKLDKLNAVRGQLPELVRRLDRLKAVMVQPSHEPEAVTLFRIESGMISPPVQLHVSAKQTVGEVKTPTSMEARITEALAGAENPDVRSAAEWMEHLAMLKRWYYRTSKLGELFLSDDKGDLPMRRIVRGVSRVYKGEKPQGDLSETSKEYWIMRGSETEKGESDK